jgi:RNA polymerase sigma factor (sigma-70 family)
LPDQHLLERFLDRHDTAAFEALLDRYGPMVLSVCRRVLSHEQDAEDAFQATFLVLVRKAASIRKQQSIGSWLHGVAYRISLKARALAVQRRLKDKPTREKLAPDTLSEVIRRDVSSVLDEELNRLPQKYRTPIILCYFQGKTNEEAAQLLSLPAGTVKTRLARARGLLQTRLARRGCTLSVAGFAQLGEQSTTGATMPAALAHSTVQIATLLIDGAIMETSSMSGTVATLLASTLSTMLFTKVKIASLVLFLATVLATGAGLAMHHSITATPDAKRNPEQFPMAAQDAASEKPANEQFARTDLYGDPLPPDSIARLGTVRLRHEGFAFAFSPDGTRLASAGRDGAVRLWDAATGKLMRKLPNHHEYAYCVAFSPDGKLLASGDLTTTHLWECRTGHEIASFRSPEMAKGNVIGVYSLAFSPEGTLLAVGEGDMGITLWEVAAGKAVRRLKKRGGSFDSLAFSPDGKTLVSASERIVVWDVASGAELRTIPVGDKYNRTPIALSSDGKILATGSDRPLARGQQVYKLEGTLHLWDVATGKILQQWELPAKPAGLAISPSAGLLAYSQFLSQTVHLRDIRTGKELHRLEGIDGPASVTFSPDGKTLAVLGRFTLQLWEVSTAKRILQTPGHEAAIDSVAVASDGRVLASGCRADGTVRLWDTRTGRQMRVFSVQHADPQTASVFVGFTPDGKRLVTAAGRNVLRLWERDTGRLLREFQIQPQAQSIAHVIEAAAISADGRTLIALSKDQGRRNPDDDSATLQIWDLATGKEVVRRPDRLRGNMICMSPDGTLLAEAAGGKSLSGAAGMPVAVREVRTGRHLLTLAPEALGDAEYQHRPLAFSPDGNIVATGSAILADHPGQRDTVKEYRIRLWELATGKEILILSTSYTGAAAFSPDGKVFVSAGVDYDERRKGDDAIHLWDLASGKELAHYQGQESFVHALSFFPDGKRLATGMVDSTILLWDVAPAFRNASLPAKALATEDLEQYWVDLAGGDAHKARAALWALAGAPALSVPWMQQRLRPREPAKPEKIAQVIADLESGTFAVREAASQLLRDLDTESEPALRRALQGTLSLEARQRMEQLLAPPRVIRSPEVLRRVRAVQVLEIIGSAPALQVLKTLVQGPPEMRETQDAQASLRRLADRVPKNRE